MSIVTETTSNHWAFAAFLLSILGLCAFMLICGFLLGGKSYGRSKNVPFESGINPAGSARLRISIKFYLTAVFFVIFDVEALYLYAWAISIRETGWIGLIEATIFIFIFLIGLVYLARVGALNWTPDGSHRLRQKAISTKFNMIKK